MSKLQKQISNLRKEYFVKYGLYSYFEMPFFDELIKVHPNLDHENIKYPIKYHFERGLFNKPALFMNDDKEPVSLNKSVMPRTRYDKFNHDRSFRLCINAFEASRKLSNDTLSGYCAKCNTFVKKKSLSLEGERFIHIDHFGEKQFVCIKNDFVKLKNLKKDEVLPEELTDEWISYHNENAKLRILCNVCNCKKHNDLE